MTTTADIDVIEGRTTIKFPVIYRYRDGHLKSKIQRMIDDQAAPAECLRSNFEGIEHLCAATPLVKTLAVFEVKTAAEERQWRLRSTEILEAIGSQTEASICLMLPFRLPFPFKNISPSSSSRISIIEQPEMNQYSLAGIVRYFESTSSFAPSIKCSEDAEFMDIYKEAFRRQNFRSFSEALRIFETIILVAWNPIEQTFTRQPFDHEQESLLATSVRRSLRKFILNQDDDRVALHELLVQVGRRLAEVREPQALVVDLYRVSARLVSESYAAFASPRFVLWACLLLTCNRMRELSPFRGGGRDSVVTLIDQLARDFQKRLKPGSARDPLTGCWGLLARSMNMLGTEVQASDAESISRDHWAAGEPENLKIMIAGERLLHAVKKAVLGQDPVARNLGSGLIDQSQKMTAAAIQMAEKNVWAHRS